MARDYVWRVLHLLNLFRLTASTLLLVTLIFVPTPRIVGDTNPTLAFVGLCAMLTTGITAIGLLRQRWPSASIQASLYFVIDVVAITVAQHASGGVSSGLGGLLVISVGGLALLVRTDRAFFLAAMTTLVLLGEQTFSLLRDFTPSTDFIPAGILGAVIFVITGVVQFLRHMILETEALAEQRGVDLRNQVELNDYIIQHLRESIVVIDGENRVRLINESAGKILGVTQASNGVPLETVSPELAGRLERWRDHGNDFGQSTIVLGAADEAPNVQPHFAGLGEGRDDGVVIFLEDTSLIADRVQQAKLAALGRLSASIAHEIRNPLGALSHAGQLLAESESMDPDDHRLTDIIQVNSKRVSQIVDSVLTLSKRDKTRPERLDLSEWARDFADEFVRTQELYEGAVAVRKSSANPEVKMDRTHLHQIAWNLCENAVKYASQAAGAIAVEIECGVMESSGRPYLEVADRGPGIDTEKTDEVFEPFFTGQLGGTGLGLYISRELAERNGATLRYHARAGGGSIFRIVFADPSRWQLGREEIRNAL